MKQAVILAAGASTRTYPLTLDRPKPLLPLLNKPLLCHTLDHLMGLVDEVILVVGYRWQQIREQLGDYYHGIRLTYRLQQEQLGTGHALQQAADAIRGPFLVLNGDDLTSSADLARVAAHDQAVLAAQVDDPSPFGLLELDKAGRLRNIVEKPRYWQGQPLTNTGVYAFEPQVLGWLEVIPRSCRGEYELVDVVRMLPPENRCQVVPVEGYWLPVGYPWNLLEVNAFLLAHAQLPPIQLPGVTAVPPLLIGPDTTIERGCHLGPATTIGHGCRIAAGSRIERCLIMDDVTIGPDCLLSDTVVGEGAVVEAGVITRTAPERGITVWSRVKGQMRDTGRSHLGAIIGSRAQIGRGSTLQAGVKVWPGCRVPAGSVVSQDVVGG